MVRKASLSVVVLVLSLAYHAVAAIVFLQGGDAFSVSYDPSFQVLLFLGLSAAVAVVMFLVEQPIVFRLLVAFRLLLIAAATFPFAEQLTLEALLATVLILEISIYESFPLNLAMSVGVVVLCLYMNFPIPAWGAGVRPEFGRELVLFGAVLTGFAVVTSLVNLYRVTVVDQDRQIERLGRALDRLGRAINQYQRYASEASEQAALEERKRISRQIHDVIGYTLTNLVMMMEAATDLAVENPVRVSGLIEQARSIAHRGLESIRKELQSLRAIEVEREVGIRALHSLVKVFEEATMVSVKTNYGNLPMTCGPVVDDVIYHFVQEGLTNAFRHGKATHVDVFMFQNNGTIHVSVRDNGVGADKVEEGIGMQGMRERLAEVDGRLEIRHGPTGFEIRARIPYTGAR